MSRIPLLYRASIRGVRAAAPLLALGSPKLARGIAGRRGAHEVLAGWGSGVRDPARPTAWIHAPSVGEALQAGAVVRALAERRPGLQVAFTHFSPSAERMGERLGADVSAYLPWDVPDAAGVALDAVRPDVLVFTKTEVWPVLAEEAARRSVPVALVAATVPHSAGRRRWVARRLLRSTWESLDLACACSADDAERLIELGMRAERVHVTGDPGVDSAAEHATRAHDSDAILALLRDGRPTVVAGSTWADDEAVLLPALLALRSSVPGLRVVLAPHEPRTSHVLALVGALRGMGWKSAPLAEVERAGRAGDVDAVVVDRVGVLAHLYAVGLAAYVGGGFGNRGLHSVLEPAAVRVPVVFGPRHERSAAAEALLTAGGARSVVDRAALGAVLAQWLTDPAARDRAAEHAFLYIERHRGAARRTAELLDPLLPSRPLAPSES